MSEHQPSSGLSQSVAEVATPLAARYLTQICKHFEHKRPVTYDKQSGHIAFPVGDCYLRAEEGVLKLSVETTDPAQLEQLQDVVARHLVRFAFRDPPEVRWQPAAGAGEGTASIRRLPQPPELDPA